MALSVTGFDADGIPDGQRGDRDQDFYAIGGAWSKDGLHWTKLAQPLLVSSREMGQRDPAVNALYHRPSLIYDGDRFRIWFDYWNAQSGLSMGMAELVVPPTVEGFASHAWVIRQGEERPAIANWPNPSVVKVPGGYVSFADPPGYGEGWAGRKIVQAFSKDGLNWQVQGHLQDVPNGCAALQIPEPVVIGSKLFLTMGCQRGGTPYSPDFHSMIVRSRELY